MRNQSVSYEGMQEIYNIACSGWKKKIQEWTTPFTETMLTVKQVKEMYEAADDKQKVVLDKWLNKKDELEEKLESLVLPYKKPTNQAEKVANALIKMAAIAEHYNEGTILKWEDTNQYKYQPYKYYENGRFGCRLPLLELGRWCPFGRLLKKF